MTDDPRTIENITEEIHEAVNQIEGVDKYILMAYSISGVYGMKYIDRYRDEVTSFIGLDTSTPNMLDGMEMIVEQPEEDDVPPIPEVNEEYRKIAKKVNANKNLIDENARMKENFEEAKKYPFPTDLSVAFFIATEWMTPEQIEDWVKDHSDLVKDSDYAETYEIDGNHLLYLEKTQGNHRATE